MRLDDALAECPLVAILRGVRPDEVVPIGEALYSSGIRIVEVPMNSPRPLDSVARLARDFSGRMVVGAGTVVKPEWVEDVRAAGGEIIIAPNTDAAVIRRARDSGLEPMPGFATPSEAFVAHQSGARYLKLFPAASLGPAYLKALTAVLPTDTVIIAVGGVTAGNIREWWDAGARAFGIGSEIYRPGQSAEETRHAALAIVAAVSRLPR